MLRKAEYKIMSLEKIFELLESGEQYKQVSTLKAVIPRSGYNYLYCIEEYRIDRTSFKIVAQFTYSTQHDSFIFNQHTLWHNKRRYSSEEWYDQIKPYIFLEDKIDDFLFLPYIKIVNELNQLLHQTRNGDLTWKENHGQLTVINPTERWMKDYILSSNGFHNKQGDFLYQTFIAYNSIQNLDPNDVNCFAYIHDELWHSIPDTPTMKIVSVELNMDKIKFPALQTPYPLYYEHSTVGRTSTPDMFIKAELSIVSDTPITDSERAKLGAWVESEVDKTFNVPIKIKVELIHRSIDHTNEILSGGYNVDYGTR